MARNDRQLTVSTGTALTRRPDLPTPGWLQPGDSLAALFGWKRARRELQLQRERNACETVLILGADEMAHRERMREQQRQDDGCQRQLQQVLAVLRSQAADDAALMKQMRMLTEMLRQPTTSADEAEQIRGLLTQCSARLDASTKEARDCLRTLAAEPQHRLAGSHAQSRRLTGR